MISTSLIKTRLPGMIGAKPEQDPEEVGNDKYEPYQDRTAWNDRCKPYLDPEDVGNEKYKPYHDRTARNDRWKAKTRPGRGWE